MNSNKKTYKSALKELENFESNLGYVKAKDEPGTKDKTLSALKKCFQLMSNRGKVQLSSDKKYDLKDLFIDGFDQEQIWQQIELRNCHLRSYVPVLTDFILNKNEVHFPCLSENKFDLNLHLEESSEEEEGAFKDTKESSDASSLDTDEPEQEKQPVKEKVKSKKADLTHTSNNKLGSIVDDEFFKLSEMEKFLDKIEKEEVIDNEIDYFEDIPSDSESVEKNAKYSDFFSNPDSDDDESLGAENDDMSQGSEDEYASQGSEDEDLNEIAKMDTGDIKQKNSSSKKVKFSMTGSGDSSESETEEKTSFELRESKLREKIKKMEEKNLTEKPWKYKGEVEVSDRPVNSLLEEVLDVDLSARPPPVITEAVTDTLEQIIINRIKDSAYDDVERKIKPVHVPHELKKELVLNQEKSKFSLAEVYEQEFLKRKPNDESAEEQDKPDPEKEKILKAMKSVFHKLNVLSNFHYTPKPVSADIEIVSNIPAIAIEEVTPAAVSDATLLAPQEVGDAAKKKLLGKDERTKTDKLRERRKKKAFLSRKFKKTNNSENTKISKVLKSRSVDLIKPTQDSSLKSSTSFFKKLQENNEAGKFVKNPKKKKEKK